MEIALIAAAPAGPILFDSQSGTDKRQAWKRWTEDTFATIVVPHLIAAHAAAELGVRELVEVDRQLDPQIPDPTARQRSTTAGRKLLERHEGARHLKAIPKLIHQVDSKRCPGHAASVFALQCTLFHVPVAPALIAYLFLEWQAAGGREGLRGFQAMTPNLASKLHHWLRPKPFQPYAVD